MPQLWRVRSEKDLSLTGLIVCSEVKEGVYVRGGGIVVGYWAGTRVSNYRDWADRQLVALDAGSRGTKEREFPSKGRGGSFGQDLHLCRRKYMEGWKEAEAV